MAAFFALVLVSVPIIDRQLDVKNLEVAKNETDLLSERLGVLEQEAENMTHQEERKVASSSSEFDQTAEQYSKRLDPWGQPYQIHVVKNTYGQVLGVAVWSTGPNAKSETDESRLWVGATAGELHFGGDDIGSFYARHDVR